MSSVDKLPWKLGRRAHNFFLLATTMKSTYWLCRVDVKNLVKKRKNVNVRRSFPLEVCLYDARSWCKVQVKLKFVSRPISEETHRQGSVRQTLFVNISRKSYSIIWFQISSAFSWRFNLFPFLGARKAVHIKLHTLMRNWWSKRITGGKDVSAFPFCYAGFSFPFLSRDHKKVGWACWRQTSLLFHKTIEKVSGSFATVRLLLYKLHEM